MSDDLADQRLAKRIAAILPGLRFPQMEQGTYTPTYQGGTLAGTTTHTFQSGKWSRQGNQITVIGQVAWSAATGTGEARISLPFAPVGGNSSGSVYVTGVTFANSAPQMLIGAGAYFTLGSPLTNAAIAVVQMEAAGNVTFQVTYFVA
jgi:hypothetical protein